MYLFSLNWDDGQRHVSALPTEQTKHFFQNKKGGKIKIKLTTEVPAVLDKRPLSEKRALTAYLDSEAPDQTAQTSTVRLQTIWLL